VLRDALHYWRRVSQDVESSPLLFRWGARERTATRCRTGHTGHWWLREAAQRQHCEREPADGHFT